MDKEDRKFILCGYIVLLVISLSVFPIVQNFGKSEKATFEEFYNETLLKYDVKEFDANVIYWDSMFNEETEYLYNIDNKEFYFKERQIDLEENKTIKVMKTRVSIYGNDNFKYKEDFSFRLSMMNFKDYYSYEIPSIDYKEEIPRKDAEEIINIIQEEYDNYVLSNDYEGLKPIGRLIMSGFIILSNFLYLAFFITKINSRKVINKYEKR